MNSVSQIQISKTPPSFLLYKIRKQEMHFNLFIIGSSYWRESFYLLKISWLQFLSVSSISKDVPQNKQTTKTSKQTIGLLTIQPYNGKCCSYHKRLGNVVAHLKEKEGRERTPCEIPEYSLFPITLPCNSSAAGNNKPELRLFNTAWKVKLRNLLLWGQVAAKCIINFKFL